MSAFQQSKTTCAVVVGASRGIGLEFVRQFLQMPEMGIVFAAARQPIASPDLAELATQAPDRLCLVPMDVTDEAAIAAGVAKISAIAPQVHWVVNCVGLLHEGELQPEKSLKQLNPDHLLRYFQVNSIATALLAKHLLPLLKHGDRSVFASISAKVGSIGDNQLGGWYGYRASKAALNMFVRTAAIEYRRRNPNTIVVALHPGTTDTDLSKPFQRNVPPDKLFPPERTVQQLLGVMNNLTPQDSGEFFSWNGDRLPW